MTILPLSRFRNRLILESRRETPDGAGGVRRLWEPAGSFWAAIETLDAQQRLEAGQIGQRLTHRVTLRYVSALDTTQRFRRDQDIFVIRGIRDPDDRKKYLVCLCEEVRP